MISITNICQDSLLAVPLIIDLVILGELFTRVSYKDESGQDQGLYSVLSLLSYMLSAFSAFRSSVPCQLLMKIRAEAPLVRPGTDVVNGLGRQRGALEHFMRALIGLQPLNEINPNKLFW
jgi:myo-inositol-1-phosphate synthase